jgi:hypothetical protein
VITKNGETMTKDKRDEVSQATPVNYRGTGLSKEEYQKKVNLVIAQFKKDNPGKPVPIALERWVDNIADDKDVEVARKRMAKQ